MNFPRS